MPKFIFFLLFCCLVLYQLIYVNIFFRNGNQPMEYGKLNEDAVTAPTLNSFKGKIEFVQ